MQLHIEKIENLKPLSGSSEFLFKRFSAEVFKHISALMVLSANDDSFDWHSRLVDVVSEKLDAKTRETWKAVAAAVDQTQLGLWTLMEFLTVRCRYFDVLEENEPQSADLKDMSVNCRTCDRRHYYYLLNPLMLKGIMKFRRIDGLNLCKECMKRGHVHVICMLSLHCNKCKLYQKMRRDNDCEPSHLVIASVNCYETPSDYYKCQTDNIGQMSHLLDDLPIEDLENLSLSDQNNY